MTLVAVLTLTAGVANAGLVANVITDWNSSTNPSNGWSYYYGPSASTANHDPSTYVLMSGPNLYEGSVYFKDPIGGCYVFVNKTAPSDTTFLLNWCSLQPSKSGANYLAAAVGWTAPAAMTVNIAAEFVHEVVGGDGGRWSIDKGSTTLTSGTWTVAKYVTLGTVSGGDSGPVAVNNVILNAGDSIYFNTDVGGSGDISSDTFGFLATITEVTAVPEPSTLLLLGIGALGMSGYARKRMMA